MDENKQNQNIAQNPTAQPENKEIDVDALLKLHGLSKETNNQNNNTKWIALGVMTVFIIIFMIAITLLLNSFKNS